MTPPWTWLFRRSRVHDFARIEELTGTILRKCDSGRPKLPEFERH